MPPVVRKVLFWLHLIAGVSASVVMFVLCVTGVFLAAELPVTTWADRDQVEVPADAQGIPSVMSIFQAAAETHGGELPKSVSVGRHPQDPAVASWGRRDRTQFNPWTLENLGKGNESVKDFFHTVMTVHRWFALEGDVRDAARVVTGGVSLLMLLLIPTGLLLWLPRPLTWKKARSLLVPKRLRYGQALEFQWHHALGLWAAIPLLFLSVTGAAIGFHWLNDGIATLAGGEVKERKQRGGPPADPEPETNGAIDTRLQGADEALAYAAQQVPEWRTLSIEAPNDKSQAFTVVADTGNGRQMQHQKTLTISRDIHETARKGWAETPRERQSRIVVRFGHTGEMFGTLGILLAAIVTLAGAFLAWSGLALSVRRFLRWRASRNGC